MADEDKLRQYLKKATGELQQTARRLREVELRDSEPIAIVGIGCVFPPDLRSAADLWRFVAGEGDGISPFPDDRGWDPAEAGMPSGGTDGTAGPATGRGGFIAGADLFDAEFFGVGEHEALAMDPQQRLLLETAWAAVEHAGLDPASLRGTQTGVYAGVSYSDYSAGPRTGLPAAVADQLIIGSSPSTASGRVSYTLGLRGPAISIDTACSSSLVAIHLACQALRRGECELALAGGATIMATPSVISEFARRGALAGDGRCKPFASAADGMGFGEGAGLLVLERLSVAQRNDHSVLAVIRGSAINQDGATNGLTSPSRSAQEAVIRQALANAGLTPDQVDAVEGHGTGTALGDSIEAEALIATYGEDRPAGRPLRLGSVKSNIGHTQTASGVAGVIKIVMSMRAGTHARTLHIDRPSDYVDWSDGTVVLTTEAAPWPAEGRPRRAGVSSFGISGTNAHLILEEPAMADPGPGPDSTPAVSGSAHSAAEDAPAPALPWVLSAKTEPALRAMAADLADFLAASPATVAEVGVSLARTRSGFAHRAVSVAGSVEGHLAALAALARGADAPGLRTGAGGAGKTAVVFSGRARGAASALGAPGTPDAEEVSRGLAERFPAFAEAYEQVCKGLENQLDRPLAAYPLAGAFATQVALHGVLSSYGVAPDLVAGSGIGEIAAAHVGGILSLDDAVVLAAAAARGNAEELRAAAKRIGYSKPGLTVVGLGGDPRHPDYWATGEFLHSDTGDVLAEIRTRVGASCLELDSEAVVSAEKVLALLAAAYTDGTTVAWKAAFAGTGAGKVRLPGYPFQRRRYWLGAPTSRGHGGTEIVREPVHPLLGGPIDLAGSAERRFSATLTGRESWYAAHYKLGGTPTLPPAAVAEWALAAACHGTGESDRPLTIENLAFGEPTALPGTLPLLVQTTADPGGSISGFTADPEDADRSWIRRFTASAASADAANAAAQGVAPVHSPADLDQLRARMSEENPDSLFSGIGEAGIVCGPALRQATRRWWRAEGETLALVETDVADHDRYLLHPVVLEACFLATLPLVAGGSSGSGGSGSGSGGQVWLPSSLARLTRHRALPRRLWCHARRTPDGPIDLELWSDAGDLLATITGLRHTAADLSGLTGPTAAGEEPDDGGVWDVEQLSRLSLEDPEAARQLFTDLLFARVTALVEGLDDDRETLRARFPDTRLGDLGLDSLRAMRLREQLRAGLSVDVPPQRLLGDTTVADVADLAVRLLAARSLVVPGGEEPAEAGEIEELIL